MLLNQISLSGFSGTAPTPVERYAIDNYLTQHELFNLLPFVDLGQGTNIGNIQVTVLTYDTPEDAQFRRIGNEYDVSNNVPKPVTLILKQLGGAFQTDRVLERAFSTNPRSLENWTKQQIAQKINAIINSFCKYFISGDSDVNDLQFDGLMKFFDAHPGQINGNPMVLTSGLNFENALNVETFLNSAIARMAYDPTAVITTRTAGKPFLMSLESHRYRGVKAININSKEYNTFKGIPIIGLEDSCFPAEVLERGTPFIFVKFDEEKGIHVVVPQNPGMGNEYAVLDIVRPNMKRDSGGLSVFVKEGGVELCCVPVMVDPYCAAMCYISENQPTKVSTINITGPVSVKTGSDTNIYNAAVTPDNATNNDVVWSLEHGTGAGVITKQTGNTCKVQVTSDGTVTLKAVASDGSGVSNTLEITGAAD